MNIRSWDVGNDANAERDQGEPGGRFAQRSSTADRPTCSRSTAIAERNHRESVILGQRGYAEAQVQHPTVAEGRRQVTNCSGAGSRG